MLRPYEDKPIVQNRPISPAPLVHLEGVTKHYTVGSERIAALDGVTLDIPAGEFVVVLGPSGSGKTTLLNLLGGLEAADGGIIVVGGQDVARLSEAALTRYRRRQVGFVFQYFNLLPTLTALENVEMSAELAAQRAHDPRDVLVRVGLGDRMNHYPGQLSGGQQQRVAVARALVKNPTLVLADEPTGSLDVQTGVEVLRVMRSLNRETGQTFVLVTHNSAIARIADRVVRLGSGRVREVTVNPAPAEPEQMEW